MINKEMINMIFTGLLKEILSIIVLSIFIAICGKLFNFVKKLRIGFSYLKKRNSFLKIEMSILFILKNSIHLNNFGDSVGKVMSKEFPDIIRLPEGILKFRKLLDDFEIKGEILAIQEDEDEVDRFNLIVSSDNLKFKKLKKGLQIIHDFIFLDIFILINRDISIDIADDIEGLTVYFETRPKMIENISELKIGSLSAKMDSIKIEIKEDKIRATGKFENFETISKVVNKNFISS